MPGLKWKSQSGYGKKRSKDRNLKIKQMTLTTRIGKKRSRRNGW